MTGNQTPRSKSQSFVTRKWFICLAIVIALIIIGTRFIYKKVDNIVKESTRVNEYYREGYYAGHEDASNDYYYGRTKIDDFDKLLPELKLAFDAGYGYGYYDYFDDIFNEDARNKYVPWDFSNFEWHIYSIVNSIRN